MLRPLDPAHLPPPSAYLMPWRVLRDDPQHPVVINDGMHPVDFVRVFRDTDSPPERTQLWGQVLPGERIELCLCMSDIDEVVVTVAWFRQADGLEYLWRFVL